METREEYLKMELSKFLLSQSAEASISAIDDIVLSYMVSILEELASETGSLALDVFDVDQFTEMMEAYLPGFAQIDSVTVSEWMFQLAGQLGNQGKTATSQDQQLMFSCLAPRPQLSSNSPPGGDTSSSHSTRFRTKSASTQEEVSSPPSNPSLSWNDCYGIQVVNGNCGLDSEEPEEEEDEEMKMLMEMFPAACSIEITHCLCVANGNMEQAAQLIIHRQETGESITESQSRHKKKPGSRNEVVSSDDPSMKKHILSKYSYVDVNEDKTDHKPIVPKVQPKKLVRYLDSKVVSTKGERFTEIKRDDEQDMKKTYVNLKPARQYRFH